MAAATLPGDAVIVLVRPSREDTRVIGYYLGRVTSGIGLLLLVPLAVAIALGELNDVFALSGHCGAFVDALSGLTTPHLHLTNACSYDH